MAAESAIVDICRPCSEMIGMAIRGKGARVGEGNAAKEKHRPDLFRVSQVVGRDQTFHQRRAGVRRDVVAEDNTTVAHQVFLELG